MKNNQILSFLLISIVCFSFFNISSGYSVLPKRYLMTTKESNDGSERFFVFARPTLTLPFRIHSPIRKPPIYESISSEESIDKNVLTKHNAPDNQNFEDQKAKRQMTYSHLLKQPIMGMSQWWTYKASDDDSEE